MAGECKTCPKVLQFWSKLVNIRTNESKCLYPKDNKCTGLFHQTGGMKIAPGKSLDKLMDGHHRQVILKIKILESSAYPVTKSENESDTFIDALYSLSRCLGWGISGRA